MNIFLRRDISPIHISIMFETISKININNSYNFLYKLNDNHILNFCNVKVKNLDNYYPEKSIRNHIDNLFNLVDLMKVHYIFKLDFTYIFSDLEHTTFNYSLPLQFCTRTYKFNINKNLKRVTHNTEIKVLDIVSWYERIYGNVRRPIDAKNNPYISRIPIKTILKDLIYNFNPYINININHGIIDYKQTPNSNQEFIVNTFLPFLSQAFYCCQSECITNNIQTSLRSLDISNFRSYIMLDKKDSKSPFMDQYKSHAKVLFNLVLYIYQIALHDNCETQLPILIGGNYWVNDLAFVNESCSIGKRQISFQSVIDTYYVNSKDIMDDTCYDLMRNFFEY